MEAGGTPGSPATPRRTLRLVVSYDGTDFIGWQVQEAGRSVQGCLMQAFAVMLGTPVHVRGAGRTDAGVHALGQVASADVDVDIPPAGFLRGLNSHLDPDVAVLEVTDARPGFNPRLEARGKVYRYHVFNHPVRAPLDRRTSWHVRRPLDVHAMREAAASMVGEHDFRAFRASDCTRKSTTRLMHRIEVRKQGAYLHIEVEGTAFLKNMVRIMAGTIVAAGQGRVSLDEIRNLLTNGDRTKAGMTAPAAGLTLVRVIY